jgi:hypothetical protein
LLLAGFLLALHADHGRLDPFVLPELLLTSRDGLLERRYAILFRLLLAGGRV